MAATISVQVGATVESVEIPTPLAVEMSQALQRKLPMLPDETAAAHALRGIKKYFRGLIHQHRKQLASQAEAAPPELGIEEAEDA